MKRISAFLFLLFCATTLFAEVPSRFQGKLSPCVVKEMHALCGDLKLWENRTTKHGRKIPIHVVVLPALGASPVPDPVFFFEGGPGDVGTNAVAEMGGLLKDLRDQRDIVFFDQRGTGGSNPLNCDLPGSDEYPQGYLRDLFPIENLKRCLTVLQDKADLTQYSTPIAMDDVDEIREWLGYERINLYGISYGTLAASVYLRQHERHVRSVVLMGVAPITSRMPLHFARYAQTTLERVFDDCGDDFACHKAFPDLRGDLRKVFATLDQAPARATITNAKTGKPIELTLPRTIFAATLRSLLYDATSYYKVPLYLHLAAQGNFAPMAEASIAYLKGTGNWAIGQYLSVTCAEDTLLINPKEVPAETEGTFLKDDRIQQQLRACELWPRSELPADHWDPIHSAAPVLILSGWMDPATPPEEASEVASHLPNSLHLVSRDAGHGPFGLENENCEWRILRDFIKSGAPYHLDTSCMSQMHHKPFLLQLEPNHP